MKIIDPVPDKSIISDSNYRVLKKVHNPQVQRENIGKIISSFYYVREDEKVLDLASDLDKNENIQAVGVTDGKDNIKGIIIKKDLFNILGKPYGQDILKHKKVEKYRTAAVKFGFDRSILSVAEEIQEFLNSTAMVCFVLYKEENKFAGIFTSIDMMMYLSLMTQRDMRLARDLQNKIVKEDLSIEKDYFKMSCASHMAKGIGGDYYSVTNYENSKWFITICDVCGKGLAASLVSTSIAGMLNIYDFKKGAENFISKLNYYICRTFEFVTAAFIDFDETTGSLRIFDMGHSYIYLFKQDKLFRLRASGGNIPLGIQENVNPQCDTFILTPGDLFIMITDGIVEQTNPRGEEFGEKRLYKIIKNNKSLDVTRLKDILLEEIATFRAPQTQNDDITAVFLSYNGISPTSSR